MKIKELEPLTTEEREELLRAPAYIVMLATNAVGEPDEIGRRLGLDFNALNEFTCDQQLVDYFKLAKDNLQGDLLTYKFKFPDGKAGREKSLKDRLHQLAQILKKLKPSYAEMLRNDLNALANELLGDDKKTGSIDLG